MTDTKKDGVEELENRLRATTDDIRKILGGKKDKKDVSDDEKSELRAKYSQAAQIARTLANRCTDTEKSAKYSKFYKQLSEAAASYGSVIKSKVPDTTLDDVKGLDNVKALVKSFIFMARNPQILKYYKMEGGLGMLMYGAPGTGKTMFAEAIANAMNLPLFIVTPADIFKSYVGESEKAVKEIFDEPVPTARYCLSTNASRYSADVRKTPRTIRRLSRPSFCSVSTALASTAPSVS